MSRLPTVKVENPAEPGGFMLVNEADFDKAVHKLWQDPQGLPKREPKKPIPATHIKR